MTTTPFTLRHPDSLRSVFWGLQEEIGRDYLDLTRRREQEEPTDREVDAWLALADETAHHAAAVRMMFDVRVTDNPEPYPSSRVMQEQMRETGIMYVSSANCEHPIWTPEENVNFRIVHDGLGHYLSGGAFSWQGELDACSIHFRMVQRHDARRALFTECVGQVAAYYVNDRTHAPQVIGFLPEEHTTGILHP